MSQRESMLAEMGLAPIWKLRREPRAESQEPRAGDGGDTSAMSGQEREKTQAFGLAAPALSALGSRLSAIQQMDWPELKTAVAECRACALCKTRKQAVLGVGDVQADWLFVGEGPGAEEDERGEPFVGQAGKLLDAMLAAIDLKRGENIYIANAVKCRPPGNRTPEPDETAACWPYLERQIDLIKPRLIVALGRPAAQTLLQGEVKIAAARGRLFEYRGIPVIVTYHPAYLLRNLADKAKAWEDLLFARRTMRTAGKKPPVC